jgi:predicted transcriptional regulator
MDKIGHDVLRGKPTAPVRNVFYLNHRCRKILKELQYGDVLTTEELAKRTGLTPHQVEVEAKYMRYLGLLEMVEDGKWKWTGQMVGKIK